MSSPEFQHILILKPTALGDVAQALLAVPQLKLVWPGCRLSWVVDEAYLPLVQACPAVDHAIPFPRARWKQHRDLRGMWRWAAGLKNEKADVTLDLQGLARSALMGWASGAPRRIGLASAREGARFTYHALVPDTQAHAIDRYLAAVAFLTGKEPDSGPSYLPPLPDSPLPEGLKPATYTLVHPYSQWTSKLWNWGNYDALFNSLPAERFVLIGNGPFFPITAPNTVDLRGRTSLAELLAVTSAAKTVLSTDSGPLHIAAAFNRPLIALFGATDPRRTGPRAQRQIILNGGALEKPLAKDTYRAGKTANALAAIRVAAVVEAWKTLNT